MNKLTNLSHLNLGNLKWKIAMHKEHVGSSYGGFITKEKGGWTGGGGECKKLSKIHEYARDIAYFT